MYWYLEVMRKYGVFSGRARRKEYWMFQLINFVVIGVLFAGVLTELKAPTIGFFAVAMCGYVLATIIPGLAVSVRRLHDINFSGWWLLISFVPGGGLVLLVFHALDSTPGPNRYGSNPKGYGGPAFAQQYAPSGRQMMTNAESARAALPDQRFLGFCNACGMSMQPGARFCPKCGKAAY